MRLTSSLAALLAVLALATPALAEQQAAVADPSADKVPAVVDTGAPPEVMAPANTPVAAEQPAARSPMAAAIAAALQAEAAAATASERDIEERGAIAAFYESRQGAPLWFDGEAMNARAESLVAELAKAGDYGLDASAFTLPKPLAAGAGDEARAAAETALTHAAMLYARHARGGRIMHPAQDLSSYLDRAPQLQDPKTTLAALAATTDAGAVLRDLHPKHPQFELLRQKYLALRGAEPKASTTRLQSAKAGKRGGQQPVTGAAARSLSPEAKRVLANMEEWRWMPIDMGDLYVWNNIPEYTLRVYDKGEMVHTERIVAGLLSKQTPIFSRPMRKIVFRPKWKIPESIKVREIWPSLLHGGGLMRQFGLRIETKEGEVVPTNSVDWTKTDIRNYEVIQPPGPHAILGNIKFTFPNQHTVYMHDTQDKHLFAATQRTYSHGCMRVRNPAKLAEAILSRDKGYDAAKIDDLIKNGPLDNAISIDRKVPVHITYFTAMVGEDGKLVTFKDVYGHERRITLALEGRWSEIVKGRDHLAPVVPDMAQASRATPKVASKSGASFDFVGALFSGGF